jgi:hypothetical protein
MMNLQDKGIVMETINLLQIPDRISNASRAIWTSPISGEDSAPERRIIHTRCLQSEQSFQIDRIGIQLGVGFCKCGGKADNDWIRSFRVLALYEGTQWQEILRVDDVSCPTSEEKIRYYELNHQSYTSILIEIRRAGIDEWWTSWNLVMDGFILEGSVKDTKEKIFPSKYNQLSLKECSLEKLPDGVQAYINNNEVRYRNDFMDIGFRLNHTGFSYFSILKHVDSSTTQNLLQFPTLDHWSIQHLSPNGNFWRRNMDLTQGLHLHSFGNHEQVGHYQQDYHGTVHVIGNQITYHITVPTLKQQYRLTWTIEKDCILLDAERNSNQPLRLWSSGIWSMSLTSKFSPTTVIGDLTKTGQAGALSFPVLFHAPTYGTLKVNLEEGDGVWRFDSIRPDFCNVHEIKCGEIPQPEGDYLLPAGKHRLKLSMTAEKTELRPLQKDTPEAIIKAVNTSLITGLTFRPDLATLSNNGNSIHSPLCMDNWSALNRLIHAFKPEWHASDLLRFSLERWLLDGTGYASGRSYFHDGRMEDEFIHTGISSILGLAEYIRDLADPSWIDAYRAQICDKINQLYARDIDSDGLLESQRNLRNGVSGSYEMSTNWYDIISFGWKDAFANALLYKAVRLLEELAPRFKEPSLNIDFNAWANLLKASYIKQFYNEKTGWFGGWRCKNGELHDYAFIAVNGAASVCGILDDQPELHRSIIEKLFREMHKTGFKAFQYGLPGNLWSIPGSDTHAYSHHRPFGCYQNGGATLSQARFFVQAMYRVGLTAEADRLLESFCIGINNGEAFAGCGSGIDWRMWDGIPCGYEGLLTDQLGIMIPILERYYV